jgi:glycosyltransferase involved in cell wall biosynthesis
MSTSPDRTAGGTAGAVPARPSLVLAANAAARAGGQGQCLQNMIDGLGEDFALEVFCRRAAGEHVHLVPAPRAATFLGRIPVVRRRRDWFSRASDVQFDRWVVRRLPAARVFVGMVGHCRDSMKEARARGMRTVLDSVTAHVDQLRGQMVRECERFGVRPPIGAAAGRSIHEEYATADLVRVMTERAGRTFLERRFPAARLVVAMPPIDVARFPRAAFGGPRFRVVFVGLIEPWKGFHYLLEAYARLALPDAELVLWGGTGSRPAARMIREYQARVPGIRVQPFDPSAEGYAHVYAASSVLVHPSLSDGFAFSVAEAMASGLPAIVTESTGAADLIVDGVSGFVVPAGSAEAIAARLEYLYHHRDLLPALGAAAHASVERLTLERFRASLVPAVAGLAGA